jgi:hypothetical protein
MHLSQLKEGRHTYSRISSGSHPRWGFLSRFAPQSNSAINSTHTCQPLLDQTNPEDDSTHLENTEVGQRLHSRRQFTHERPILTLPSTSAYTHAKETMRTGHGDKIIHYIAIRTWPWICQWRPVECVPGWWRPAQLAAVPARTPSICSRTTSSAPTVTIPTRRQFLVTTSFYQERPGTHLHVESLLLPELRHDAQQLQHERVLT